MKMRVLVDILSLLILGNFYQLTQSQSCNAPIPISDNDLCASDPCSCDEVNDCNVCNHGCSQCSSGYWKLNDKYQCTNCNEYLGDGCMFCQDYIGCAQCITGYTRTYDSNCGYHICEQDETEPITTTSSSNVCNNFILCENSPCSCDELITCSTCHTNGCTQCDSGYFKKSYNYPCINCEDTFGNGCEFCSDFEGCGQCIDQCTREYNEECEIWECNCDNCVEKITVTSISSESWTFDFILPLGDYYYSGINERGYPYYEHDSSDSSFYISPFAIINDYMIWWNSEVFGPVFYYGDATFLTQENDIFIIASNNNPFDPTNSDKNFNARGAQSGVDIVATFDDCPNVGMDLA